VVPRGDAERARAQRRLDQRPEDADALLVLARNAANADEDAEARQLYLRLLTLRPDDHRSRRRLAWVEQRLGEAEAALQTLDAIPAEADEAREVAAMWALLLVRTGQTDAAERVLAPLDPEHPLVAYAEAQLSLARGELEAAVDQLSTALLRLDRASPEDQVEIHRELALDPALAPLRSSARIRLLAARLLKPTSG
jgi:tetratricopeptide (TPR) repeat protein